MTVNGRDRTKFLGASEIADVFGLGKGSAYEVWARKMGHAPEKEATPQMTRGSRLEPLIKEMVAEDLGIADADIQCQVELTHPDHPFVSATLDCVIEPLERIEEWKTAGYWPAKEWESGPPQHHVLQATYQTAIAWRCELAFAPVLRLIPMETLVGEPHPIKYDPELGDMLIEGAVKFWTDHVLTGNPPPLTGGSQEAEFVKARFAVAEPGVVLVASEEQERIVLQAMQAKLAAKHADQEAKRLVAVVQEFMGTAEGLALSDGTMVTWKQRKGNVSWKGVATELGASPDLIAKHTPAVGPRVFLLPMPEDEE